MNTLWRIKARNCFTRVILIWTESQWLRCIFIFGCSQWRDNKICVGFISCCGFQSFNSGLKFTSRIRGANLSPFGEIRRFHLEIGHSRESCRSVKKNKTLRGGEGRGGEGRGVVVVSASHLCHVTCSVFFPSWQGMVPPYSASDWLTLMSFPHPTNLTPEA